MSSNRFALLLSIFFLVIINYPLNAKLVELIAVDETVSWDFVATLPLFFVSVFFIVIWFISLPYILKPLSILLVMISAIVSYSMHTYGVVFDYAMIKNVFETNYGEASSYLNVPLVAWFVGMGLVPSVVIARTNIRFKPWLREVLHKVLGMTGAISAILVLAFFYYKDYSAFGRNNAFLSKMIVPTEYLAGTYLYLKKNVFAEPLVYQQLGTDAVIIKSSSDKPRLMIFVLGETARSQNYQLNGYPRETNMFTKELGVISIKDVSSCGTATAESVPCMFSRMSKSNFDDRKVKYQDGVIDVLSHAGAEVVWLENDGGCKGVCDRVETWTYTAKTDSQWCVYEFCYDLLLLDEMEKAIDKVKGKDAVIVLHVNGSHGPTYYQRYTEQHRHFVPDCQRSDIQNCTNEELVNTYDNTILATDYVVAEAIKRAKSLSTDWDSSVVYISDHGESLGEKGVYLHGMPYSLAPEEQTKVPWLLWLSDDKAKRDSVDLECLKAKAEKGGYSHDNLFDTLLGLIAVRTEVYKPELDLVAECRS